MADSVVPLHMKRYLPFLLIALAAVGCVSGGILFYRAKVAQLSAPSATAPAASPTGNTTPAAQNPAEEFAARSEEHIRGEIHAPVTLEEFGDFECPPCAFLAGALGKIEHDYGAKLRVIFRHFPLQMHKHALDAARFAEAAGLQGHFWDMHDLLYKNRDTWSKSTDVTADFFGYAAQLPLDVERLRADFDSDAVRERVQKAIEFGKSRGVSATPTIFINDTLLPPSSFSDPALRSAIDSALKGEPPAPAETSTPTPPPAASATASPQP